MKAVHWWRMSITESRRDGVGYRPLPSRNVWLPDAGTLTIGIAAPADVIIADDFAKDALLARLEVHGDDVQIIDLTGRGIRVNGERHERTTITNGDYVILGVTYLRFVLAAPSVPPDAEASGGGGTPASASISKPSKRPN